MPSRIDSARAAVDGAVASDELSDLTAEAAELSDGGHAQISLLTDHEVIVAVQGAPIERGRSFELEDAVCTHVLRADATVAIADAQLEPRTSYLAIVERGLLVSYLGAPVRRSDGEIVGVLCIWDDHPREWAPGDLTALESLADRAAQHLHGSAV